MNEGIVGNIGKSKNSQSSAQQIDPETGLAVQGQLDSDIEIIKRKN
jgi:hypothetical protein